MHTAHSFRTFALCLAGLGLLLPIVPACSSSSTDNSVKDGGSTSDGSSSVEDSGTASGDDGGSVSDASSTDAGSSVSIEVGDGGCVTYQTAQKLCGTASDDSVCKYSVTCGKSTDDSQCKINCEMAATVTCYTKADAQCLLDAVATQSCSALKACKWIL
jgi:hypothetical protein